MVEPLLILGGAAVAAYGLLKKKGPPKPISEEKRKEIIKEAPPSAIPKAAPKTIGQCVKIPPPPINLFDPAWMLKMRREGKAVTFKSGTISWIGISGPNLTSLMMSKYTEAQPFKGKVEEYRRKGWTVHEIKVGPMYTFYACPPGAVPMQRQAILYKVKKDDVCIRTGAVPRGVQDVLVKEYRWKVYPWRIEEPGMYYTAIYRPDWLCPPGKIAGPMAIKDKATS